MIRLARQYGFDDKFTVLKRADVIKYATEEQQQMLADLQEKIREEREAEGKIPEKNYLVIAADELYAPLVAKLMTQYGHCSSPHDPKMLITVPHIGIDEYERIDLASVSGIFVGNDEIVITGMPADEDETHNCDLMGCSSVSHVIKRGVFRSVQQVCEDLEDEKEKERRA